MTILTRLFAVGFLLSVASPCLAAGTQQAPSASSTTKPGSPPTGKAQPPPDSTTRTKSSTADTVPRDYVIGPSDVIEIAVWNNEAVSRTVPVRPDGKISLQLINDVQAAGMTPMQLRDSLSQALASYVQNPEVSVIVREVHSFKVSVMGEVKEPGRFDLTGRVTVLDVLAMAKGLTQYADKNKIAVLRREQGVTRTIPVEYQRLLSSDLANGKENFLVQPDDIIVVR
jgi:polysaccharide export outer membrane protein